MTRTEVSAVVGTYTGTDEDGNEWSSVISADGTYRDMRGGATVETGTWQETDGLTCFTKDLAQNEAAQAPDCFAIGNVNEDGQVLVVDIDGRGSLIQKVEE